MPQEKNLMKSSLDHISKSMQERLPSSDRLKYFNEMVTHYCENQVLFLLENCALSGCADTLSNIFHVIIFYVPLNMTAKL